MTSSNATNDVPTAAVVGDPLGVGHHRGLVADRTLLALEVLGSAQGGLGVSELGRRLGVDKSTAHRLLATLQGRGFVRFNPSTQRYLLGFRLMSLAAAAARDVDPVEVARPIMEGLRNACGEAVSLAILTDGDAMIVSKLSGTGVITVNLGVGSRMPVHASALGKTLVAWLPHALRNQSDAPKALDAFTPRTIVSADQFNAHLEGVRMRGWAIDDEEVSIGLRCVAAPVRNSASEVVAALGISGPVNRVTLQAAQDLAQHVIASANELSSLFGWVPINGTIGPAGNVGGTGD